MRRSLLAVLAALVVGAAGLALVTGGPAAPSPVSAAGIEPNTTAAGEGLVIEAKFVSSRGWVKPGAGYPFQVLLRNESGAPVTGISVSIPAPDGAIFLSSDTAGAAVTPTQVTWTPADLAAGTEEAPTVVQLVVEARAKGLAEDSQIVWKDLSASALVTYTGGPGGGVTSTTHGPKVIPDDPAYDSARYGDRPFPVVPVAYTDRAPSHSAEDLAKKINDKDTPGSTYNLYQEMSFGQLFPQADVPSAGVTEKDFTYAPGFDFTQLDAQNLNTCAGGATLGDQAGGPLYPDRIVDGWYQLPGNTAYYGSDSYGSALIGAESGVGTLQAIDSGCGPTAKGVYDAAQIADPEIDYDDYDTDKDGLVDFFMMVFTGLGGNGESQLNAPPYDNIWPHSASLEFEYQSAVTGLGGYETDDQLHSLDGVPQCWVNDDYLDKDGCTAAGGTGDDALPVHVRVGPYNVNPESAVDHASVISHEYGHSLGLPDFYSTGARSTYGDFNLMATDKSQNMDVFSRQELGWVVPSPLEDGTYTDLEESDTDIHHIDWQEPDGTPYALQGSTVHNGPAWMAKLPGRKIIDEDFVKTQASGNHLWWSQSGNDFGCPPVSGHNLDVYLPEMAALASGTDVELTFKSYFDIEWDYDYGFVLVSTDGGKSFTSLASKNGYTTASQNPNNAACQTNFGNGITGTGGAYDGGTTPVDRLLTTYGDASFVSDAYDLTPYAGKNVVLRFGYSTDPGAARPGWFVDDLAVKAGSTTVYATDFESTGQPDDPHIFNGGCKEGLGAHCTHGWQFVTTSEASAADHAYYLELRDRSGFDQDGHGENDRDPIGFSPGLLLTYTDEAHGYGNVGTDDPPAQTPLDSQPESGNDAPDLNDATFTAASGDSHFDDQDWVDNYTDAAQDDGNWHLQGKCLSFDVTKMSGTDVGPATAPGDLKADLDVDMGDGCAVFDYGRGHQENQRPTAYAQAKSTNVQVGAPVTLDGSGSYDDLDLPADLHLSWDTDGDGHDDVVGQTTKATFDKAGVYAVRLTAVDSEGLQDTDTVTITVTEAPVTPEAPETPAEPTAPPSEVAGNHLPATGTSAPLLPAALGLLALAAITRRLTTR